MQCDPKRILTECKRNDICGKAEVVELTVSGKPKIVVTRSRARARGAELGQAATAGSFAVVEVNGDDAPFCIGQVDRTLHSYEGEPASGYCGKVEAGDDVVELRRWMPLENGGGSSTYQWTEAKVLAPVGAILFTFSLEDANKTHFKVSSDVTPECPDHHKLLNSGFKENTSCDICNADGTHWRCSRRSCNYDLCTPCKKNKSSRRRLLPSTKLTIFNKIPNLEHDPYEGVDGNDIGWWGKYETTVPGVLVKDIALDVKVSLAALIENNGDRNGKINLKPDSRLLKGTTLWIPGEHGAGLHRAGSGRSGK